MWNQKKSPAVRRRRSGGYTMTELLAVIAIIAVVCAIAIPSVFAIRNSLRFRSVNNYAESIFLAAQTNLTEMRSNGSLGPLQKNAEGVYPEGSGAIPDPNFPTEAWAAEYVYTTSEAGNAVYDMVLPRNSLDATVREKTVIIEFNPFTGNVYAVFYSEDPAVLETYRAGRLPREADARKDMMLGYYSGSGLGSSQLELERSMASMTFDNGEEGMVTVRIPVPELYYDRLDEFAENLEVRLTVAGERGGSFDVLIKPSGTKNNAKVQTGNAILVSYPLDSLKDCRSFANLSTGTAPKFDPAHPLQPEKGGKPVTDLKTENTAFYGGKDPFTDAGAKPVHVLPGDNVTVTANIAFNSDVTVNIEPAIIAGINPMFDYVRPDADGELIISVSNGRNLQNLNAIAPSLGVHVSQVHFSDDIYWNQTADYYNDKYGVLNDGVKVYENRTEAPARALPYFVPIHSESLFGTARFIFPGEDDGELGSIIGQIIGGLVGIGDSVLNRTDPTRVPTLTDSMDLAIDAEHAVIEGNNHKVYFLNIDSNQYQIPAVGTASADKNRQFYAAGNQLIDYSFTGLFGYVNTPVSNLSVVNPVVRGLAFSDAPVLVPVYSFNTNFWEVLFEGKLWVIDHYEKKTTYNNPATGALVGASGYNTLISNCSTYIDTGVEGFSRHMMTQGGFEQTDPQNWYGVSGEGAVGGLVGYAKSHRTVSGDLTEDDRFLAFHNSFAAVPVSGNMRGSSIKDFGYSNGVGGLLGNSQLTNFYNCYASGSVRANGAYVRETHGLGSFIEDVDGFINGLLGVTTEIPYDGRTGIGAGGFVGTSHGTRYTNCFATGTVDGSVTSSPERNLCVGGFVGVMSLDESLAFGHDQGNDAVNVAQTSIFTDSYSVGLSSINGQAVESFSGANARIRFSVTQKNALAHGDYFRLLAPLYAYGKEPAYPDVYIFRSSYYLSDYYGVKQINSNSCAASELYATLTDLPGNHQDQTWIDNHIEAITKTPCKHLALGFIPTPSNYGDEYFDTPGIHEKYAEKYREAYSAADWEPATLGTTHAYDEVSAGVYPFSKLVSLDYYGRWPSKPSAVGLAYYEEYENESARYYYYDSDETSELRNQEDTIVTADGYAVLSASGSDSGITVSVAGNEKIPLRKRGIYTPGSKSYSVFPLTRKVMQQAAKYCTDHDTFYAELTINDGTETYTTYFNPNVALTQVNPIEGENAAVRPDRIPAQIKIRSARQLAGVAEMSYAWGENSSFVQMLNVDFDKYKTPKDETLAPAKPIGNEKIPFLGAFDGSLGYVKQAKILGLEQTESLFGTVGKTGKITNLSLTTDKDPKKGLSIGGSKDEFAAMVALENLGQIRNVDLTLERPVTLTARDSAGLLAAHSSGMISDCEITAKETVNLQADMAGLAIGRTSGAADDGETVPGTVQKVSVTAAKPVTAKKNLGGFAGTGTDSEYTDIQVSLNGLTGAKDGYIAGFACGLDGGRAEQIDVTLNGAYQAGGFAGFLWAAGQKNSTALNELTVSLVSGAQVGA